VSTTLALSIPSERANACTRVAAVFMSRPFGGIDESPMSWQIRREDSEALGEQE